MKHYIRASQSNEQDSMGNPLTPEQSAFFKNSKVRDSQGRLLVCYHGTKKAGFEEFLPQDFTDSLYYKFGKNNVNCFTTEKYNAMSYSEYYIKHLPNGDTVEPEPYDFVSNYDGTKSGIYAVYLNITNPLVVDPDNSLYDKDSMRDERTWKNIKREGAPRRAKIEKFFNKYSKYRYDDIQDVLGFYTDEEEFEQDLKRINISMEPYEYGEFEFWSISNNNSLYSEPKGYHIITTDSMEELLEELEEYFEDYQTDLYYEVESTNDIIIDTLMDHPEYDGIIFKDILDSAGFLGMVKQNTIVTLKGSNQIKSIFNQNPTNSGNINAGNQISGRRYIRNTSDEPKYLNEPRLYEIHETTSRSDKVYTLMMTGKELKDYLKAKREMNGYIPGCGGNRSYDCWAVELQG